MKVCCLQCNKELKPCPASFDGEPTFVEFEPCTNHPNTKVRFEELGLIKNTIAQQFEHMCKRLSDD